MSIDPVIADRLKHIFLGHLIIDRDLEGRLEIRSDYWMITSGQLRALGSLGLVIDSIMVEGSCITLIIDKETSKKVIRLKS